jgi:hypothetical protein
VDPIEVLDTVGLADDARTQVGKYSWECRCGLEAQDFAMGGLVDDPKFHALLRSGHVEPIHSKEATLADVFVEITGRALS